MGEIIEITAGAALLDMDGTIVDSTAAVERIWGDWARDHGLDPEFVMPIVHGRQGWASMAKLLPDRPMEQNLADNAAILAREVADTEGIVAIPGAAELLEAIDAAPHALVTSASEALAQARMRAAGLPVPRMAIAAENVAESKPHPEGFLLAANRLGIDAADCVAFEDSNAGIAAARAAGMRVVGVGVATAEYGADWAVADLTAVSAEVSGSRITLRIAPIG